MDVAMGKGWWLVHIQLRHLSWLGYIPVYFIADLSQYAIFSKTGYSLTIIWEQRQRPFWKIFLQQEMASLALVASCTFKSLTTDPSVVPNSDDTSKTLTALQLLGRPGQFSPLVKHYEREKHFACFGFERNPSLSANCNVLLGFVQCSNPAIYFLQIEKCVRFICDEFWNSDTPLTDKWVYTPGSGFDPI